VTIISGIGIWIAAAGPAGASATLSPRLADAERGTKVAVESVAPYSVSTAPKRLTVIPKARQSKHLTTKPGQVVARSTSPVRSTSSGELSRARSLLSAAIARHPILRGSTVEFGDARGYQAICYYRSGRIVISRNHSASLDRIINHEVWHIIDWRDNGRIDWGENVPRR
jgi:hypothetical protein